MQRHPKAARFIRSEHGADLADCLYNSQNAPGGGLLFAGTDPPSRIAIDGKDTGRTTPVGFKDHVILAN